MQGARWVWCWAAAGRVGRTHRGSLSVLLPELKDQVRVIVGTSAGALISAYLVANWHRSAEGGDRGRAALLARAALRGRVRAADGARRGGSVRALHQRVSARQQRCTPRRSCTPGRWRRRLTRLVDFDQLGENITRAAASRSAWSPPPRYSNRSVVFHQGGIARHHDDPLRGIEYVATPKLAAEHMLASSAIPALFPAVRVTTPERCGGLVLRRWPAAEHADQTGAVAGRRARDRDRAQFRRLRAGLRRPSASPTSTSEPRTCCTPRSATRWPRTSARWQTQTR